MNKLYRMLKSMVCSFAGAFIGYSLYQYYHYKKNPGLYELQSAPWYTDILVFGASASVFIAVILIIMWLIRKK